MKELPNEIAECDHLLQDTTRWLVRPYKSRLTYKQILQWADEWHRRTGKWPTTTQGRIPRASGETWAGVNWALRYGMRGLPGGPTLAKFLSVRRGKPYSMRFIPGRKLTARQIATWARQHFERTGRWPTGASGPVYDVPGETWSGINAALTVGCRGFSGGDSLAKLLDRRFRDKRPSPDVRPDLRVADIRRWAKEHHERTGRWPHARSGRVVGHPWETWSAIAAALRHGWRGVPGGGSLCRLLHGRPGAPGHFIKPPLTERQIRRWAEAYRQRFGKWPTVSSGAVPEAPDMQWHAVDLALRRGGRGLPGGKGLGTLLGTNPRRSRMPLTIPRILTLADDHFHRTGAWPHAQAGPVAGVAGLCWMHVHDALVRGHRGLRGGTTLKKLLVKHRGLDPGRWTRFVAPPRPLRKLTFKQIMMWAKAHHRRYGEWPDRYTGPIPDAAGETWLKVDDALAAGTRGLPGGSSLAKLLARKRAPASIAALLARVRISAAMP